METEDLARGVNMSIVYQYENAHRAAGTAYIEGRPWEHLHAEVERIYARANEPTKDAIDALMS